MGACYSKSGAEAGEIGREKRPRDKKTAKNGHASGIKNPRLLVEVQKDVSDTVYTEDSHVAPGNIDDCINKSQQTSLDQLARDSLRNSLRDSLRNAEHEGFTVISSDTHDGRAPEVDDEQPGDDADEHGCSGRLIAAGLRDNIPNGKVSASDSGIVVEHSSKPCDMADVYSEHFETRLDSVEDTDRPVVDEDEAQQAQSVCLCSNLKHSDCYHSDDVRDLHSSPNTEPGQGESQGHLSLSRSYVNKSSDSLLKSSLKKNHTRTRGRKRLSWKSADSLNWIESIGLSLDRTKSMCSSILGDDISLCNAPLATFESVDFAIGDSYDFSKLSEQNKVEYSSDTFQFQFDFSGLEEEDNKQSIPSIDRLSERSFVSESSTDLDRIKLAIQRQSSSGTPVDHR